MSKTRLVFIGEYSQTKSEFAEQEIDLIRVGAAANHGYIGQSIHQSSVGIGYLKTLISGFLDQPRHAFKSLIPGDGFPVGCTGCPVKRLGQTLIVDYEFFERNPLRAQCAAINWAVRISLDMHYCGFDVAGPVTKGVNNHAAAHGAVGTDAVSLCCTRDLQFGT